MKSSLTYNRLSNQLRIHDNTVKLSHPFIRNMYIVNVVLYVIAAFMNLAIGTYNLISLLLKLIRHDVLCVPTEDTLYDLSGSIRSSMPNDIANDVLCVDMSYDQMYTIVLGCIVRYITLISILYILITLNNKLLFST